jgi:predicted Abi (CAAX) family protease
MNPALGLLLGALAFGIAQAVWSIGHAYLAWPSSWVLEPNFGIVLCLTLLAIAAGVASFYRRKRDGVIVPIIFVVLGALVATIIALFIVGPGNLWPIVLVVDAVMVTVAVAVGGALGNMFRKDTIHAA